MSTFKAIPTNVITGFLGIGKTTAILNLLKQKPDDERWAVLVNEFGEVGIDGSLLHGKDRIEQGIFIKEVPGGCMCCAAGLSMHIALNMLIAQAKPHRLIIEPTGLGHHKEVLDILSSEHYRSIIDLRVTLTLVDARKIQTERYTTHPSFNQQLEVADIIVANKSDLYQPNDFPALLDYIENKNAQSDQSIYQTSMGKIQQEWLIPASSYVADNHPTLTKETEQPFNSDPVLPSCGYVSITNKGEGFYRQGWIFKNTFTFNRNKLQTLLTGLNVERIKAVFITDHGIIAYNQADAVLTEIEVDEAFDSRIECIDLVNSAFDNLEQELLDCLSV
jgi:G3E family GTPase